MDTRFTILSDFIRWCSDAFARTPAILPCCSLITGISLIFAVKIDPSLLWIAAISVTVVVIIAISILVQSEVECFEFVYVFIAYFIIGVSVSWLNLGTSDTHFSSFTRGKTIGCELQVHIDDVAAIPNREWLAQPTVIRAAILQIRYSQFDKWREASGTVLLRLYKDSKPLYDDDIAHVAGRLTFYQDYDDTGYDSFPSYILTRNAQGYCAGRVVSRIDSRCGVLNRIRYLSLDYLVRGLDERSKQFVAALLGGVKQAIDFEEKQDFYKAGIGHIFAVSGLHIGILSSLIFFLLAWVPIRIRYAALPIFLCLYLVIIGWKVSAVRAVVMISIWALYKASLRTSSNINTLFVAALLVLICSPLSLFDLGFHYSFVIVLFLLAGIPVVSQWRAAACSHLLWYPRLKRTRFIVYSNKIKGALISSFFFCSIAWIASAFLSWLYHGRIYSGAVLANMSLIPVLFLFFVAVMIHCLGSLFLGSLTTWFLSFIIDLIYAIANFVISLPTVFCVSKPEYLILFLGTLLFFLLIISSERKSTFYLGGIASCLVFLLSQNNFRADELIVIKHPSSSYPSFVFFQSGGKIVRIVNLSHWDMVRTIGNLMKEKGYDSIESVHFENATREVNRGLGAMLRKFPIDKVFLTTADQSSSQVKRVVNQIENMFDISANVEESLTPRENILGEGISYRYEGGLLIIQNRDGTCVTLLNTNAIQVVPII